MWIDNRDGYSILAQRYSADGTKIGTNFIVNDKLGTVIYGKPDIFIDPDGNFTIIWNRYRDGLSSTYAQRYLADGTAIGENFALKSGQGYAAIAATDEGNFIIAWRHRYNGHNEDGSPHR